MINNMITGPVLFVLVEAPFFNSNYDLAIISLIAANAKSISSALIP